MSTTRQKQIETLERQALDTSLPMSMRQQRWEQARVLGSRFATGMSLAQAAAMVAAAKGRPRPALPAKPKPLATPVTPLKVRQKALTPVQQQQLEVLRKQLADRTLPARMRHEAIRGIQALEGTTAAKQRLVDRLFTEEPDKAVALEPYISATGELDIIGAIKGGVPDEYLVGLFESPAAYKTVKTEIKAADIEIEAAPEDYDELPELISYKELTALVEKGVGQELLAQAYGKEALEMAAINRADEDLMAKYAIGENQSGMMEYDIYSAVYEGVDKDVFDRFFLDEELYDQVQQQLEGSARIKSGEWVDKVWLEGLPAKDRAELERIGLDRWEEAYTIDDPVTGHLYDKRVIIKNYGDRTATGAYTGAISQVGWDKLHSDQAKLHAWLVLADKGKLTEKDYGDITGVYGISPNIKDAVRQAQLQYQQLPTEGKAALKRGGLEELSVWADSEYTKSQIGKRLLEEYTDDLGRVDTVKFAGDAFKGASNEQAVRTVLKGAGFSDDDINEAVEQGQKKAAEKGYFEKGFGEKAVYNLQIMGDIVVPGYWAAKHWDELDDKQKVGVVVIEALTLIPYLDAAGVGARQSVAVTHRGRALASLSTVPQTLGNQLMFPYHVIKAPITTTKFLANQVKGLAKPWIMPRALPEAAVTQAYHTIKLRLGNPERAKVIMDDLMEQVQTGNLTQGRAVVVDAETGLEFSLRPSAVVREYEKGAVAHGTPDVQPFIEGTVVKSKPTLAEKEQFLFVGPDVYGRFTERTAFGLGTKEVMVESAVTRMLQDQIKIADQLKDKKKVAELLEKLRSELAKNKAELIGKLEREWVQAQQTGNVALMEAIADQIIALEYRAKPGGLLYVQTAPEAVSTHKIYKSAGEAELGYPVGYNMPKLKHRYTSRVGFKDIDVYSENPLGALSIAKLKMLGLVEKGRALYSPPLQIKRIGPGTKAGAEIADPAEEMYIAAREAEEAGAFEYASMLYDTASQIRYERALATREFYNALRSSGDLAGAIRLVGAGVRVDLSAPDRITLFTNSGYRLDIPRAQAETALGRSITTEERQRALDRVTSRGRVPVIVDPGRIPVKDREPRLPEEPRIPEIPETPRIPEEPRISRVPEVPRVPEIPRIEDIPRVPRIPEIPRIPRVPRVPEVEEYKGLIVGVAPPPKREEPPLKDYAPFAWRQGFGWWVWYPPFGQEELVFEREAPAGAHVVEGVDSAYKTIQAFGDETFTGTREVDMGIMDLTITSPGAAGKEGSIKYERDIKQKTTKKHTVKKRKGDKKSTTTMMGKGDKAVKGVSI